MSEEIKEPEQLTLPMIALRGLVVFPKMILHFNVAREKSVYALNKAMKSDRQVYLVAQKNIKEENPELSDLYKVGVVATINQIIKAGDNTLRVVVEGQYRARMLSMTDAGKLWEAQVEAFPLKEQKQVRTAMNAALIRTVKELFEEYCYFSPKMPTELISNAVLSDDSVYLVEYIAQNIPLDFVDKQKILTESSVAKRLELLCNVLEKENNVLSLEREIYEKVREQVDKNQREYYLREQLKVISGELGENDQLEEDLENYAQQIMDINLDEANTEKLMKEVERLYKMPVGGHEAALIRSYLDTVLALPWKTSTKDKLDIKKARALLDKEHYGMEKIKDRIIENVAVRALAPDIKGQILCFVGPPGVGKTSIAKSIAKAMGRKYVRISLGGVRDESDIRGHRKTYVGAMAGRIIGAVKQAGSNNPLMLLDEIDKMGNDFRGDPSSAMLEVLDSEQNSTFRDHYIEVPFDLSNVLFIATANDPSAIPAPLYDRMEVIDLSSYTREEKFHIAKRHLLPKQMSRHGLTARTVKFSDESLYTLIDGYTREAGVRTLEREIAAVCRKCAKQLVSKEVKACKVDALLVETLLGPHKYKGDELEKKDVIGVVNGLAWTSVGGEILQVEVAVLEGTGKLELTGSLGDVMKESAHAAISYVRSCAAQYSIPTDFYKTKDIHIHFPEGAVPKDGPSAGVTIITALVSALSGIAVRQKVAMTGEITLRGRVLAIGGLKEKTMAAYRHGIKTVLIPKGNVVDLYQVDPIVKAAITFIPADEVSTVLEHALICLPKKADTPLPHPDAVELLSAETPSQVAILQ